MPMKCLTFWVSKFCAFVKKKTLWRNLTIKEHDCNTSIRKMWTLTRMRGAWCIVKGNLSNCFKGFRRKKPIRAWSSRTKMKDLRWVLVKIEVQWKAHVRLSIDLFLVRTHALLLLSKFGMSLSIDWACDVSIRPNPAIFLSFPIHEWITVLNCFIQYSPIDFSSSPSILLIVFSFLSPSSSPSLPPLASSLPHQPHNFSTSPPPQFSFPVPLPILSFPHYLHSTIYLLFSSLLSSLSSPYYPLLFSFSRCNGLSPSSPVTSCLRASWDMRSTRFRRFPNLESPRKLNSHSSRTGVDSTWLLITWYFENGFFVNPDLLEDYEEEKNK